MSEEEACARFTFDPDPYDGSCECSMEECKTGEYVRFEAIQSLQQQLEQKNKDRIQAINLANRCSTSEAELIVENERLKQQLSASNAARDELINTISFLRRKARELTTPDIVMVIDKTIAKVAIHNNLRSLENGNNN